MAMVKLSKLKVPELVMMDELFMVIVPAEGVKVPVTFKTPPTAAVWVPAALIVPLIFRAPVPAEP